MKAYPDQEIVKHLVLTQEWAKAREILNSITGRVNSASVWNDLALVEARLGRNEQALSAIAQALSKPDADARVGVNRFYLSRMAEMDQTRGENARERVKEMKPARPGLKPKISIIMRTFDRGELIRDSVQSVINQSFRDWELIIVNDGGGHEVEKTLELLWDQRVVYAYARHSGDAGAFNVGLRLARGEWIGFLDDDDVYSPDILANLSDWFGSHPEARVVYTDSKEVWMDRAGKAIKDEKVEPGEYSPERLLRSNFISNIFSFFLKRECLEKVPGALEGLPYADDWEFYIALSRHFRFEHAGFMAGERRYIEGLAQLGKRSFIDRNLQRNLILYYHGGSPFFSFGPGKSPRFLAALDQLLENFRELVPGLELRQLFRGPEYALFYKLGNKLSKAGRKKEARAAYNAARKISPHELKAWAKWIRSYL